MPDIGNYEPDRIRGELAQWRGVDPAQVDEVDIQRVAAALVDNGHTDFPHLFQKLFGAETLRPTSPMAVRVNETRFFSGEEEGVLRRNIAENIGRWGGHVSPIRGGMNQVMHLVGGGQRERVGTSRLAFADMGAWFAAEIVNLLGHIAWGRLTGDRRLEAFNRELGAASEQIMQASGWKPHIDDASVQAIADAVVKSRREGRTLIITTTHESWTDITTIASLLRGLPIRFVYKNGLLLVPGLNLILLFSDMTPVVRPKITGDVERDRVARAKAVSQIAGVRRKAEELGIISADFTPGTRSRAGAGVGVAKKGFANLAIDMNAVVLAVTVEGSSQVLPVSWLETAVRGVGTGRRVDVRAEMVLPEDYLPGVEVSGSSARRRAQVDALRDDVEAKQIAADLNIVQEWQSAATPLGVAPNRERIQFNELVDHFVAPFQMIDAGNDAALAVWFKKHKGIAPDYVRALREWIPAEELAAVYQRAGVIAKGEPVSAGEAALLVGVETAIVVPDHEAPSGAWAVLKRGVATVAGWAFYKSLGLAGTALKTVGLKGPAKIAGKVQGGFLFPLTSEVYTDSERYALAWNYLPAKLQTAARAYGLYRSLKDNKFSIPDVTQGPQPVPAELQLNDSIMPEETVRVMDDFLGSQTGEGALDLTVEQRLQEMYGFDAHPRDRAIAFAKAHRAFLLEDARRATELYRSDVPARVNHPSHSAKEEAYTRALETYHAIRWDGEPMGPEIFAALRDLHDAEIWMDVPQPLFGFVQTFSFVQDVKSAEDELSGLRQTANEFQLWKARENVRQAMDNLATRVGLGTSGETFTDLSLPAAGLGLRPEVLAYAVSRHPSFSAAGAKIIAAHKALHTAQDTLRELEQDRKVELAQAKKKGGTEVQRVTDKYNSIFPRANRNFQVIQARYENAMRAFLDTRLNVRLLQGELVRYNAAREVLLHDHHLFNRAAQATLSGSSELATHRHAYLDWRRLQGSAEPLDLLKAEEALNRAEEGLLDSEFSKGDSSHGMIQYVLTYLLSIRTDPRLTGLREAISANADYWHAERHWSRIEAERKEARLPEEIEYLAWRDLQIGEQVVAETTLMFDAAEQMMKIAWNEGGMIIGRGVVNMYNQATEKRDGALERLILENQRRTEHWHRVADPTLVLDMEEDIPLGHSISWNRAMEAAHAQAAKAYNAAARAYALATGQPRPRPVSLTATALHDKLTPNLNPTVHAERAENLITRFSGEHVLPALMHGLWVVQNNLPARMIDPVIYQWGLRVNRDFHLVKVEDRRHAERLPGTKDVADMAHNGGWYIDYSTSLVVSPEGEMYILISKNDLGDKFPPGMAEGVGLLAQFLPENTDQAVNEGTIVDTSLHGLHTDFNRRGGQNVVIYGALTMGAVTQPQVVALTDPRFLLDPQYTTGLELAGVNRPGEITRERIAVQGTVARTRGVRSMTHRGHNAGPKPDQPFGVTPTEAHVVVEEEPVLARPRGTRLLDEGEYLPDWTRRYAGEVAHLMAKRGASLEFSARELRKTPTQRTSVDLGARRHHHLTSRHGTTPASLAAGVHSLMPIVGAPVTGLAMETTLVEAIGV